MRKKIHATAGAIAFLTILTFWTSTVFSELFTNPETISSIKTAILYGMAVLVPAMVIVGASGMAMGKHRKDSLTGSKKKRMPLIAANGLLILLPAAIYLQGKAADGTFDTWFYSIQVVELVAGAINLSLMGLNIRDGLRLSGRIKRTD